MLTRISDLLKKHILTNFKQNLNIIEDSSLESRNIQIQN